MRVRPVFVFNILARVLVSSVFPVPGNPYKRILTPLCFDLIAFFKYGTKISISLLLNLCKAFLSFVAVVIESLSNFSIFASLNLS